ncbi:hypothetical protein F5X99DRAFT_369009 [Biscogniauxia marginata]|nr:hypothetical protein F5X99DRAFT_369009 [Biscogniauxia marginata]
MKDLITLETFGVCDFDSQLLSATSTAQPKTDTATGELIGWRYEVKSNGTPDIGYYSIDSNGISNQTV